MSEAPALIYLEADDEITTVVRRLADAEPGRIVIVAPGRSRATSSTVALRLLARAAERAGREVTIVGDALTRSLAADAGLVAYASVADARDARPVPAEPSEAHTAAIHIVRGPLDDETVPKLAARSIAGDETVAVPVARPRSAPPPATRRTPARRSRVARRVSLPLALGGLAAIVVAWVAIAAVVLPAATIRIVPRTAAIGPVADVIAIADPQRVQGTVIESVTVTATAPYEVNEPAIGTVIFLNWNFSPVEVPAGSLVANGDQAGDQAFETTDVIIVPGGEFDPFQGGITAGEAGVGVRAVAPGPDGNVAAEAIDTVLDPDLAGRLRGFPTITERLVVNPEATAGGASEEGVEISQEDLDVAVTALTEALEAAIDDALAESQEMLSADPPEPATPTIEIPDDLVGRRDAEGVELSGSLAYDRLAVDAADVTARAIERFHADASLLPAGHEITESATEVTIGEVRRDGDSLQVNVSVMGEAIATVARDAVLDLVIGRSAAEAEAALAGIGAATVDLWPVWVSTVPDSDWRIDLEVGEPES